MLCKNLMSSTEESINELLKNDDGGPVCMVNLLKFKKKQLMKMVERHH